MSALILPRRFYSQPQEAVQIDWDNPLTRDLEFAYDGAQKLDLARNLFPSAAHYENGVADIVTEHGLATTIAGPHWGALVFDPVLNDSATQSTVDLLIRFHTVAGGVHTFGAWNQPSTGNHWLIQRNGTGMVWVPAEDSPGYRRRWDATGLFTANQWARLILSWQGGGAAVMYLNGVNRSASLSAVNVDATYIKPSSAELWVGSSLAGQNPAYDLAFARVWRRGLSADECALLSDTPYALYKSPSRRIYFDAATGGGGPSIPTLSNVTASNLTETGARIAVDLAF